MKYFTILIFLLITFFGIYFIIGPFRTLFNISNSVRDRDYNQLEMYIDLVAVNTSIKKQIKLVISDYSIEEFDNPARYLVFSLFSNNLVNEMVDDFIVPEKIGEVAEGFLNHNETNENQISDPKKSFNKNNKAFSYLENCKFSYNSFSDFQITLHGLDNFLDGTKIYFKRSGIDWVIYSLDFPDVFWKSFVK